MIELRRLATSALLATVVLIVLLGARPIRVETILAGYALALAAIALAGLTTAIAAGRAEAPSRFEAELTRERIPPTRPPELVRVERELTLASASAAHFHNRLKPLLAGIAEVRGGALAELDEPPPQDPAAPGPSLRRLRDLVAKLEAM
jgi:hypothetical protein